jgi:hypothetical protein
MTDVDLYKNKFDEIPTDAGRWKWLKNNPDCYVSVQCDNDDTYVIFGYDEDGEAIISSFDWYVGWSEGIFEMFEAFGIEGERV